MKILQDKVLVRKVKLGEQTTKGGLIVPIVGEPPNPVGEVVAVGEGILSDGTIIPLSVERGDKIIYYPRNQLEVTYEGEKLLVITERDILMVLD